MESQGSGRYVKLSSGINTTRNVNGRTPVCKFYNNPRLSHKRAVRRVKLYLMSTSTYLDLPDGNRRSTTSGAGYNPNKGKGIECYVDATFTGGWSQADADIAENVMSRTGYVITYVGCPLL